MAPSVPELATIWRSGSSQARLTMFDADLLVASPLKVLERLGGAQQGHAAAGNDAFFHRRASGMQGVFHAGLLFLHFGLGGRADLDHRDAAGQLRQPLLQLLAVVVGSGLFDLGAELLDAALDGLLRCRRRPRWWYCPCPP